MVPKLSPFFANIAAAVRGIGACGKSRRFATLQRCGNSVTSHTLGRLPNRCSGRAARTSRSLQGQRATWELAGSTALPHRLRSRAQRGSRSQYLWTMTITWKRFDTGDPDEYVAVCNECDGEGSRMITFDPADCPEWGTCPDCDGSGNISADADDFL